MQKEGEEVKHLVHSEVENLARIVAKGFEQVDKRFEQVDGRLQHIDARLDTVEHDIADIRKHFVYRDEFEDVIRRLATVEKKLGIHK